MNTNNSRVLLLDADTIPALTVLRSLSQKNLSVDIASSETTPLCSRSKFATVARLYPNPLSRQKEFIAWVEEQLASGSYELIIPVTERTVAPLSHAFKDHPLRQLLAMAPFDALEAALDKEKTTAIASELAISLPDTRTITSLCQLREQLPELSYPVVIKPGRSISDNDNRKQLTVCYAHTEEELVNLSTELLQHVHIILQSYFSGAGVGIELIAKDGDILYAFQHRRLHEMPLTGGGSSYRESTEISPTLLNASQLLMKKLNWTGAAMVEFKMNEATGEYIFIEINGRLWGSLPLAYAAGADFPYMLYQLHTQGLLAPLNDYQRNVRCRKFSADIAWTEAVLRRDADPRLVSFPSKKEILSDWLDCFRNHHFFDVQTWSDPKPGLWDIAASLQNYWTRFTGAVCEKYRHHKALKQHRLESVRPLLQQSQRFLFVCYGNINRSAAAHVVSESLFKDNPQIEFKSAGFHQKPNRPADPNMITIAQAEGFDMRDFRSTTVTPEMIDWADCIFVMEINQLTKLVAIAPSATDKSTLLGALLDDNKAREISDPYGHTTETYQTIFNEVKRSVGRLQSALKPRQKT